jgi:hypothetical protein
LFLYFENPPRFLNHGLGATRFVSHLPLLHSLATVLMLPAGLTLADVRSRVFGESK